MKKRAAPTEPQRAEVALRFGKRVGFRAKVETTPHGLIAIGIMVSSILLSTAVIVGTARRHRA